MPHSKQESAFALRRQLTRDRQALTERQRLWIVVGVTLAGVIIASTLFEATDRTVWPLLFVAPVIALTAARLTDR